MKTINAPLILAVLSSAALPWSSLHAQQTTKESNVDVNITVTDDDNGTTRRLFQFKSSDGDLWSKIEKQLDKTGLDEATLEKIEKAVEKAAESIESKAAILGSGLIIGKDGTEEVFKWAHEPGRKFLESSGEWLKNAFPEERFASAKGLHDAFIHTNRSGHMIGVHCERIDDAMKAHLKLDDGSGLLVKRVFDDTPAEAAGVKKHDILLQANDTPLTNVKELIEIVEGAGEEGEPVTLKLLRRGEQESVTVNPEKKPKAFFSTDGKIVGSASRDGDVSVWDTNSGKKVETFTEEFLDNIVNNRDDSAIEKLQEQIESLTKMVEELREKIEN